MNAQTDETDDHSTGNMLSLLHTAADREASDVHLVPGYPVTYRIHGRLEAAGEAFYRR